MCRLHSSHLAHLCPSTLDHGFPALVHLHELGPINRQSCYSPASSILDLRLRNLDELMDLLHLIRQSLRPFLDGSRSAVIPPETACPQSAFGQKIHLPWVLNSGDSPVAVDVLSSNSRHAYLQ